MKAWRFTEGFGLENLKIVVVDDQEDARTAVGRYLSSLGADVHTSDQVDRVLGLLPTMEPDLVITDLRMEAGFDGHLVDRLLSAGHDVDVLDARYSDTMGHAGAVILHPDGTMEGGHDPRADGGADGV